MLYDMVHVIYRLLPPRSAVASPIPSGKSDYISQICDARQIAQQAIEAQTESSVWDAAVLAQVLVPLQVGNTFSVHGLNQFFRPMLTLGAPHQFAQIGDEQVEASDCVGATSRWSHVEWLLLCWVVGDEHW
jgi:hypothetical protein